LISITIEQNYFNIVIMIILELVMFVKQSANPLNVVPDFCKNCD